MQHEFKTLLYIHKKCLGTRTLLTSIEGLEKTTESFIKA